MNTAQKIELINQLSDETLTEEQISLLLDDITDALSEDEKETVSILNELDEFMVEYLADTFEELSFEFQSAAFVECLENLAEKYPDIHDIKEIVLASKEALEN